MFLCNCQGVTKQSVIDLVESTNSAFVFATICHTLYCGNSCGKCLEEIREVIDETKRIKAYRARQAEAEAARFYEATSSTG